MSDESDKVPEPPDKTETKRPIQYSIRVLIGWTILIAVFLALVTQAPVLVTVFTGCGPSNEEKAVESCNNGTSWAVKGKLDKAIADYTEAIRLNPKLIEAYYNRGLAWYDQGEYDKAIVDYSETIRLNPNDVNAYHNRGFNWFKKGELDKAIADYDEVIRLDCEDGEAFYNRGKAWKKKGNQAKAEADFKKAKELGYSP